MSTETVQSWKLQAVVTYLMLQYRIVYCCSILE